MSSLSRRHFALTTAACLTASRLAQAWDGPLTAGEVVSRIKKNIGIPWPDNDPSFRDTFKIGGPASKVTGIATSFGGNLRVLQLSQKASLNMLIVHEPTFYSDGDRLDLVKDDPLYKLKLDWANRNSMVVWRIHDHWHAHNPDGIRLGWTNDLGWARYQVSDTFGLWDLPATTLLEFAKSLARTLNSQSFRIVGDPGARVVRVAYGGHGLAQNMEAIRKADCTVISEAREYDSFEYARDAVALDPKKSAIFISHEVGEDIGMGEFALWLKPLVPEVPVKWIPTTDEFWTV